MKTSRTTAIFISALLLIGATSSQTTATDVIEPEIKAHGDVVYPYAARRNKQCGWVELKFDINEKGRPRNVVVTNSSDPLFEKYAIRGIKKNRYYPATSDGKPVYFEGYQFRQVFILEDYCRNNGSEKESTPTFRVEGFPDTSEELLDECISYTADFDSPLDRQPSNLEERFFYDVVAKNICDFPVTLSHCSSDINKVRCISKVTLKPGKRKWVAYKMQQTESQIVYTSAIACRANSRQPTEEIDGFNVELIETVFDQETGEVSGYCEVTRTVWRDPS